MRMEIMLNVFILLALSCSNVLSRNLDDIRELRAARADDKQKSDLKLWLTISARKRFLEVSWINAPAQSDDNILLTMHEPQSFEIRDVPVGTQLADFENAEGSGGGYVPLSGITSTTRIGLTRTESDSDFSGSGGGGDSRDSDLLPKGNRRFWVSSNGDNDIVAAIKPSLERQWFTTGVPFNYELSDNVTINTNCYGYWASYINGNGKILATTCVRAYPRWMNEMRSTIGGFRFRDLFIPGTHDSGSFRPNFDPLLKETHVTKYTLTQDDNISGQLLHGVRYLDIRVGYYRNLPEKFFINHGIAKLTPLRDVIEQCKNFVLDTNEIIIFGLKEFPVGFGRDLGVHRLLVSYLREQFGDLIVHPSIGWSSSLNDIWSRRQNIILAYDKYNVVDEFPHLLFSAVEQRWGNVKIWSRLEAYLKNANMFDASRRSSRPVADMAELTPDTWGVILDKHGGLRKLADQINWRISQLYRDEIGETANIVAADFIRGTTLIDSAIEWNKRKEIY